MHKILETTKFVIDRSKFVKINRERVIHFSEGFEHGTTAHWLSEAPFDFSNLNEEEKLKFVFVFNALSFCYWGEPKWTVEHNGQKHDGAWGMIVALGRGLKDGLPLLDFGYLAKIEKSDLAKILKGNVEIPLLSERWKILRKIGSVMVNKHDGDLRKLFREANSDARALLKIITTNFPSFYDTSIYKGKIIYFHKRAQLLVSDLSQIDSTKWKNTDQLTACADYKLPQILRKFRIFEYMPELARKIDNKIEILHSSEEEVEIRAATIWAVEFIKEELNKRNSNITSMGIDDHLWLATQEKFPDDKPYHRTRTTAY